MRTLTKEDLAKLQQAIIKDYGIKLEGKELYEAAFNLLGFFKEFIKFDDKGQKDKKVRKAS